MADGALWIHLLMFLGGGGGGGGGRGPRREQCPPPPLQRHHSSLFNFCHITPRHPLTPSGPRRAIFVPLMRKGAFQRLSG